jgi:hypothetical protein
VPAVIPHAWQSAEPVLCIPGHGSFDVTLAAITAQLLQRQGLGARAEVADALSIGRIFSLETEGLGLASLCYLGSATPAQIRYVLRRLRRKLPDAPIVVTLLEAQDAAADEDLNALPDNTVVRNSLSATIEEIIGARVGLRKRGESSPRGGCHPEHRSSSASRRSKPTAMNIMLAKHSSHAHIHLYHRHRWWPVDG